jgi:serine protease SohB
MTPYKPPRDSDRKKLTQDLHVIYNQFKSHIHTYRPSLDVDRVATGETWSGEEAKKIGLIDSIVSVVCETYEWFRGV